MNYKAISNYNQSETINTFLSISRCTPVRDTTHIEAVAGGIKRLRSQPKYCIYYKINNILIIIRKEMIFKNDFMKKSIKWDYESIEEGNAKATL